MRRFYINDPVECGKTVVVSGAEARHITRVLRLGIQDQIMLFDRLGNEYGGIITSKKPDSVSVRIKEARLYKPGQGSPNIIVCQALLKTNGMELVIQKSVELGATKIIPFTSRYSVPRWDENKCISKLGRWNAIVTAALKQSGARPVPVLDGLRTIHEIITSDYEDYLKIILYEKESNRTIRKVITANRHASNIITIIGPEGGFTEEEIRVALMHGFVTVGLGKRTLRAETVALAVLSIMQYEYGGMDWQEGLGEQ